MKGPKTEEERSDTKGPRTQENETNFRCPEVRLGPLPPGPLDTSNFGDGYSKHLKTLLKNTGEFLCFPNANSDLVVSS